MNSQLKILRLSSAVFRCPSRYFNINSTQGPTKEEIHDLQRDLYTKLLRDGPNFPEVPAINNVDVQKKRSELFNKEKERQLRNIGRIEKINISFTNLENETTDLIMNRFLSTPYHCAQHLGAQYMEHSFVAEVNGQLWDMHRPIEENCELKFLTPKCSDPYQVNRIFWRSCSFMLGYIAEKAFKDQIYVELHSFPVPNIRSGSFLYDMDLKIPNWKPNTDEMRVLSGEMIKLAREKLPFERLDISKDLASEMFADNRYKSAQIPEIAQRSHDGRTVTVYKVGNFLDISRGPLMNHTGQLGKCTVTAVHHLPKDKTGSDSDTMYRLQGVALPAGFLLNHFAYSLVEKRAKQLNESKICGHEFIDPHTMKDENQLLQRGGVSLG